MCFQNRQCRELTLDLTDVTGANLIFSDITTATYVVNELNRWLVEDVPLRTYYKDAANFAHLGSLNDCTKHNKDESYDKFKNECEYNGVLLSLDHNMF